MTESTNDLITQDKLPQKTEPFAPKVFLWFSLIAILPFFLLLIFNPPFALLLGLVLLIFLFLLCAGDQSAQDDLKSRYASIGRRYGTFAILVPFIQIALSLAVSKLFPSAMGANVGAASFIILILSVDVIGFSVTYFICQSVPKETIPSRKLGFGSFLLFILMGAGLCGIGAILGAIIHSLITSPFGTPTNTLAELMLSTDMPLRVLTVGILAPIFEELLFRKLLIDRLYKYGEFASILASGLMFGLFHGNFQQGIYATFLGFLWAFVYVRTGRIRYTIAMHMTVNISTSAITVYLLTKYLEFAPTDTSDIAEVMQTMQNSPEAMLYAILYSLWIILLGLVGIAGAILLIVFLATGRFRLRKLEGEPTKGTITGKLLKNPYMWLFFLSCLGLFLTNYLPIILS